MLVITMLNISIQTLIKISGVQAEIKKVNNPFGSPTGNFPVFKHCKRKLTKFQDVLTYLKDRVSITILGGI